MFVPGTRPDRVAKALAGTADRVVVDLEDGVPEQSKAEARGLLATYAASRDRLLVRVNAMTSSHAGADIAACQRAGVLTIMLPKADPSAISRISDTTPGLDVVALLESAAGLLGAAGIAAQPHVSRLALGAEDLALELGIAPGDPAALAFPMSTVVVASAAAGLPGPIAPVTTALGCSDLVQRDAAYARALGFRAKLLIHPEQDHPARVGLRPTPSETQWARSILQQSQGREGASSFAGQMVDPPVIARARRVVEESDG